MYVGLIHIAKKEKKRKIKFFLIIHNKLTN